MGDQDSEQSALAYQQQLEQQENQVPEKYESFASEVWQKLSAINVNGFTEKKGKLTYLSWASAWATLMEVFPESSYSTLDNEYFPDQTMSVSMRVVIKRGDSEVVRDMYLQVLDNRNQPLESPDAHNINNTRMRCLTKAIAMCGLGCYIYQGHDLPTDEDVKVVAKQPRYPHSEHFETQQKAMNNAETLDRLKILSRSAYDYFKKWNEPNYCKKVSAHFEEVKIKFAPTAEQEKAA